jgi:perosamine synthetase
MKKYTYGKQSISLRDIWAVIKTMRSSWLTQGPKVKEFEQALCNYTGAKYAVAVANGTAALHLSALCLDLKPGDEVITSPNTFLASANCVLYAGGNIQFADIEPETANIDSLKIEKKITPKTKAIIPVHFAGQSCDMEKIYQIAQKHNLKIIEDAAHAIGSNYNPTPTVFANSLRKGSTGQEATPVERLRITGKNNKVGSCKYSDMTIFSFHPVKTITTGEGGAITTNNKNIYKKLLTLRTIGITKDPKLLTKNDGPWYYETHHLGFNYRLSDIHSALGISQLKKLDTFKAKRRTIVKMYRNAFADDERFSLLEEKSYSNASFHLCPLLINFEKIKLNKKELFVKLQNAGLFLQVHYIPVHTQPLYKKLGFKKGDFPIAEKYYRKTISLPLYPTLKNKEISHIIKTIKNIFNSNV